MKIHLLLLLVLFLPATTVAQPASITAEDSERTYSNPLLDGAFFADPHVLKVGDRYYLYGTTRSDGYDVYSSTDLVEWERVGQVFEDPRGGTWAPDVFHHKNGDGRFYLYYTDTRAGAENSVFEKQIGVAVADEPTGPFEDQKVLAELAIDAHLFEDDDGKLYLYYAELKGGFKILAQAMSDPVTKEGEPRVVIRPTEDWETAAGEVTEGPFMLKRNGTYYLMYSGSGADSRHYAVGYATSDSPMGPFEKFPGNPIAQRSEGIYGPGHHSVVEGPDGDLWMVYHQKRGPRKSFRRFLALDPLWFDDQGVIHTRVTRGTEHPAP